MKAIIIANDCLPQLEVAIPHEFPVSNIDKICVTGLSPDDSQEVVTRKIINHVSDIEANFAEGDVCILNTGNSYYDMIYSAWIQKLKCRVYTIAYGSNNHVSFYQLS